jgi:voltage-gated potassium channel
VNRDVGVTLKNLRGVAIVFFLAFMLICVGTIGFHTIEGWSWFDSFYGTLMTVSTIGAEPENQLSHYGRVFNVGLIVLGVGVVGFAIGTFTQAMIQFELDTFVGRRRMEKEISKLRDHIIICGTGRVGRRVATELSDRNVPILMVDKDPTRAQWAQEKNFPIIIGDASDEAVLRAARIGFAKGLTSAVNTDANNIYIVLTARGLAPSLPIVARASDESAESKLRKAGATTVISPYTYAGQRIARLLTKPNVQHFIDLASTSLTSGKLDLQIEEMRVSNFSKLIGTTLKEADIRHRLSVIVLAIRRDDGDLEFNPPPERKISSGDYLICMGDTKRLKELENLAVE